MGDTYTVFVQERAYGIPLLGDMMSRIRGVPIAAGQNLFAMFPLLQLSGHSRYPVHNQLLDLEQAYLKAGYVLMDMRPQNVFYSPGSGAIQVIDSGAVASVDGPAPRGRPPLDVNDACLELLKFYTTAENPPSSPDGYRDARGIRPIVNVQQEIDEMKRGVLGTEEQVAATGNIILDKIATRSYTDYEEFRENLNSWLDAIADRNRNSPEFSDAADAWKSALSWLRDDHWTQYKFDPETELALYSV